MNRANNVLIMLTLLVLPLYSSANRVQSLNELQRVATSYLTAQLSNKVTGRVEVSTGIIDPRLRLPYCPEQDIEAFMPDYIQNISQATVVGVRCNVGAKWSIYVPVDIDIYAKVVTLKHGVSHGQIISPSDVAIIEFDVTNLHQGYFQNIDQVVNKEARRNLQANSPILHNDLIMPDIIKRGDGVLISAEYGKISVQAQGVALGNGSLGETINVKNINSNKVLQAIVVGQKRVKITI